MANILILGDTWGITPCHEWPYNPLLKEWFEFQFLKRGHPTFNKSWGGNQNHYQLKQAAVFLEATENTKCEADLVIWFHTEIVRDFHRTPYEPEDAEIKEIGFYQYLDKIAERTYGSVCALKEKFPRTKWAIIGGHAPLHSPKKKMLDWAEFRIDNWREEISGKQCPESQCFEWLDPSKGSLFDYPSIPEDVIRNESEKRQILLKSTEDRTLFYNGKNPSQKVYEELAKRVMNHFSL